MSKSILFLQWRSSESATWILSSLLFLLPLAAVQGILLSPSLGEGEAIRAQVLLQSLESWAPAFPALAFATGGVFALLSWSWDHQEGHAYALSLPLGRSRYALTKLGSGLALMLIPIAFFAMGSLLATTATELPGGLRAYHWSLSLRFLLSATLAYALFFALAAATPRIVVRVLGAAVALFVVANIVLPAMSGGPDGVASEVTMRSVESFNAAFMPLRLFTGNWMLIDV